jgi:Response regulator containing a CheY-like receiver domain and an HTH DNA-binding domain
MTIRVFLIDDHALVRTGLRLILGTESDIEVVGEAETGEAALPMVRQLKPDVVLCDLHLPGYSGLEVTERLVRADIGVRVIIVSVLEDGPLPKRLLEAGASGYLGKAGDATELIRAVRDVARGKRYLGSNVAQNLALHTVGGDASPFDALSPRELEVAMLLTQGLRQEEIAKRLSLSAKTVNTHKTRLFEKTGVQGQHRARTAGRAVGPDGPDARALSGDSAQSVESRGRHHPSAVVPVPSFQSRSSSECWNPSPVRAADVAAKAIWVPAFAGTTAMVEASTRSRDSSERWNP